MKISKRITVVALALVGFSVVACSMGGKLPQAPSQVEVPKISFQLPQVERWTLSNGLSVYYYFNDELPRMEGRLYVRGGELYEAEDELGVAAACGAQIREGGIPGKSADELDNLLDAKGASLESAFGGEFGTFSFFSLSEDFQEVFALFGKMVQTPAFNEKRLRLYQQLASDGIARRGESPSTLAAMSFDELVYGRNSAFARWETRQSIAALSTKRLREFHRRFVRPEGSFLAITGSLPKSEVEAAIAKVFGVWVGQGKSNDLVLPQPGKQGEPGIYVIERDFDQATVLLGHRGPPRHTPDQFDMKIYNRVFGDSGFGSMLFTQIRTKMGLAYVVGGGIAPDVVEGKFQVTLQTKNVEVAKAISAVMRLTRESLEQLPEAQTFADAKEAEEGSFVFKFAKPEKIADRALLLDLMNYSKSFDREYLANIEAVSRESMRQVGKRWVFPAGMRIVVVGRVLAKDLASALPEYAVYRVEFGDQPGKIELVQAGTKRVSSK